MSGVLLIDDSPVMCAAIGGSLEEAGFGVTTAQSGFEALERLESTAPDVVICDLQMPGMNGIELVRQLRLRAPWVPALILTEQTDIGSCVAAMREGAIGYILKGAPDEVLVHEVEGAIEHRRLRLKNRELEEANQAYQRSLEAMVEEKTAEVLKLQHDKAQAEKTAALGSLVAGVAHEVNNPLAVVNANLGWVKTFSEDLKQMEASLAALFQQDAQASLQQARALVSADFIEDLHTVPEVVFEAQESVERIVRVVRSLQRMVLNAGPSEERSSFVESLDDALLLSRPWLGEHRHVLRRVAQDVGDVPLSREDLTTVLTQLINNAAQASPAQGGRIELSASRGSEGSFALQVTDNGAGIPEDHLQRIFEPFFTTKEPGQGRGLGLSLVQQIVQGIGGTLRIESTLGEGTTVHVNLPPADEVAAKAAAKISVALSRLRS